MTEPNATDPGMTGANVTGPDVAGPPVAGQIVAGPQVLDDADRREVLLRTYQAVQAEQLAMGTLLDVDRTVLSRLRGLLALAGAVQLGLLVASFSVFSIFVVTRMILHLDFSRYLGA